MTYLETAVDSILDELKLKDVLTPWDAPAAVKGLCEAIPHPRFHDEAARRILQYRVLAPAELFPLHDTLITYSRETMHPAGHCPDKVLHTVVNMFHANLFVNHGERFAQAFWHPEKYKRAQRYQLSNTMRSLFWLAHPQFCEPALGKRVMENAISYGKHLLRLQEADHDTRLDDVLYLARSYKKAAQFSSCDDDKKAFLTQAVRRYEEGLALDGKNGQEVHSKWYCDGGETLELLGQLTGDATLVERGRQYSDIGRNRSAAYHTQNEARSARIENLFKPVGLQTDHAQDGRRKATRYYSKEK